MGRPHLEDRMHLLEHNRSAIMVTLAKSAASGLPVDETVAIIADTRDSVGGDLARAMTERADRLDADAEAARAQGRGEIPTLVACVPARAAVRLFEESNPSVSAGISRPTCSAHVRVIIVAARGATLVHIPVETMVREGHA